VKIERWGDGRRDKRKEKVEDEEKRREEKRKDKGEGEKGFSKHENETAVRQNQHACMK
jgi:hypothetical protein